MFTVSVGNLPPGASVLIKITYVAELLVEGENIVFSLPGSVAPWKKDAALDTTTQVKLLSIIIVFALVALVHYSVVHYFLSAHMCIFIDKKIIVQGDYKHVIAYKQCTR